MVDMDDESFKDIAENFTVAEELESKDCAMCEKLMAVVGCFIGGIIVAMGIDLLTKGGLSRFVDGMFNRGSEIEE